jgi:hypothetical protein
MYERICWCLFWHSNRTDFLSNPSKHEHKYITDIWTTVILINCENGMNSKWTFLTQKPHAHHTTGCHNIQVLTHGLFHHSLLVYDNYLIIIGTEVAWWLRYCATNQKVAVSIPDGVIGIFPWHNPSDRIMTLGSTQPRTEMSTRSISWG